MTAAEERDGSALAIQIIKSAKGTGGDVITALYHLLGDFEEDRVRVFRTIAENFGLHQTSGRLEMPRTTLDLEAARRMHSSTVDGYLEGLIERDLPEDEFYNNLLRFMDNPLFEKEEEKVFVFTWILIDSKIPYFRIGETLKVTPQEYSAAIEKYKPALQRLNFILNRDFEQWTEQSDAVLQQILTGETREERAVLLAQVMKVLKSDSPKNAPR